MKSVRTPWKRSLRAKIMIPFLVLFGLAAAFAATATRNAFEERLTQEMETRGRLLAATLGHAVGALAGRENMQRIVAMVGGEEDVALVLVVGEEPRQVLASSRGIGLGTRLDELPGEARASDLAEVLTTGRAVHFLDDRAGTFSYAIPLLLADPTKTIIAANAVLAVHIDTRSARERAARAAWQAMLPATLAVAFIGGLLFLVVHRLVVVPVVAIQGAIEDRRNGRRDAPVPVFSGDEIGRLAETLDRSLEAAERDRRALTRLHEIAASPGIAAGARIGRLLSLGLETFGCATAAVCRVREGIAVVDHGPEGADGPLPGTVFEAQPFLSSPVSVDGAPHGILIFAAPESRVAALRDSDLSLVRLLAEWIGAELSRHRIVAALQSSEEHIRAVLDNVIDGIVTIDESGIVQSFNPAAERIFGHAAAEVVGRNVKLLMPDPYRGAHDQYLRRYLETGEARIIGIGREVEGLRKDGSRFPLDLGVSEMRRGERRLFLGIIRDITERKRVERMQSEFISSVNHELRTPLTSIQGALALIVKANPEGLPEKYRKLVDIAHRNSGRLVRLINDILDIDKFEAGEMVVKPIPGDVMTLVARAIEANQTFADQFKVKLVLDRGVVGVKVDVDPDRFAQVMANLLSNAAKFSFEGSTITVAVEERGGLVRVAVTDQGEGIPEEFRGRIFGKFAQADSSTTRQRGGTGLGLAISKAIVEHHGGHIGFTTRMGLGTTFHFDLPIARISSPMSEGRPMKTRPKVLVCEDDAGMASLLSGMLREGGADCDIAGSAAEARRLLAAGHYTALTVEPLLPDEDGLSFLRRLREDPATGEVPVVVVSAQAEAGSCDVEGAAVGVVDWLTHPIDKDRLLAALDRLRRRPCGPSRPVILHVEGDGEMVQVVAAMLGGTAEVVGAASLDEARRKLADGLFDLVLLDIGLPDGNGAELLADLHPHGKAPVPVVLFTAQDIPATTAARVQAVLIKSHATLEHLKDTVMAIVGIDGREL